MRTLEVILVLCTGITIIAAVVLIFTFSVAIGCFLVALGFLLVSFAVSDRDFLAGTAAWIVVGLAVWHFAGWHFHL